MVSGNQGADTEPLRVAKSIFTQPLTRRHIVGLVEGTIVVLYLQQEPGLSDDELVAPFAAVFFAGVYPFYAIDFNEVVSLVTQRSMKELAIIVEDEMRLSLLNLPKSKHETDGEEGNSVTGR